MRQKHEEEMRWQQEREKEREAKKNALAQGVIEERQRAVEERHASAAAKRAQAAKQIKAGGPAETAPARSSSPPIPTVAKRQPRPPAPAKAGGAQLPVEGKSIAAELADQPVPRKPPGAPAGPRARVQRRASRLNRGEAAEEDSDKGQGRRGEPPSRRQWGPRPDAHVELPEVHGSYAGGDGRSEPAHMSSPPIPTHRPRQQEASPDAVRAVSPPIPTLRRRQERDRPEEMLQQQQQQRSASPPIPTLRRAAAAPAREPVAPVPVQATEARQPAAAPDVHASSTLSPRASVVALTALSKLKQRLQARKAELAREVTQGEELLQHSGQIFAVNEMSRQAASDTLRRGQAVAQTEAGLQAEAE